MSSVQRNFIFRTNKNEDRQKHYPQIVRHVWKYPLLNSHNGADSASCKVILYNKEWFGIVYKGLYIPGILFLPGKSIFPKGMRTYSL